MDWSTNEITKVKISFDRLLRMGKNKDHPDEWGSHQPICQSWTWKPEYREQYNAIINWIIGRACKCGDNIILPTRGLWFAGNIGTGKTTLMKTIKNFCSIYSDHRSPNMPRPMLWKHAKDIVCEFELRGSLALHRYCDEVKTLIIDDLGTENREAMHFGSVRNVLEDILSRRYDRGNMTMVTTNLGFGQVKEYYRQRVYDRIRETFNIIEFIGDSQRQVFNPYI